MTADEDSLCNYIQRTIGRGRRRNAVGRGGGRRLEGGEQIAPSNGAGQRGFGRAPSSSSGLYTYIYISRARGASAAAPGQLAL